jgi:hypothetical protein
MIYRLFADIVFVFHFGFVLFAVFGAALVFWRRAFVFPHLAAIAWCVAVEFLQLPCPLTTLENRLLELGGADGYQSGFIEHYVSLILYAHTTPQLQMFLGALLIIFNLIIYAFLLRREPVSVDFQAHKKTFKFK